MTDETKKPPTGGETSFTATPEEAVAHAKHLAGRPLAGTKWRQKAASPPSPANDTGEVKKR